MQARLFAESTGSAALKELLPWRRALSMCTSFDSPRASESSVGNMDPERAGCMGKTAGDTREDGPLLRFGETRAAAPPGDMLTAPLA